MDASKSCVVKERGIKSLIDASLKRKDNKNKVLENKKEITVHQTCQNLYKRESNIKIALKKAKQSWHDDRRRRQAGREFEFSTACFICTKLLTTMKPYTRVSKQSTIDNVLAQLNEYLKTDINKAISSRLQPLKSKDDSYYVDNIICYHNNCLSRFYLYCPNNVLGKPISEGMSDVLSFIINYIVENSEECQFSLKNILEEYVNVHGPTDIPRLDRLEHLLMQHFGADIVFHSITNDRLICFKQTLGKCLEQSWYSSRKNNEQQERERLVEMAAHIILQDIRAMKYNIDEYNSPSDFLNHATEDIPNTLQILLEIIIKSHKKTPKNGSWKKWENKIVTAAHILIASVRPRSFQSSVLLGLSCMIHTKYAARGLIDSLSNIGLCASYAETCRFESSVVFEPEKFDIVSDTFLQFSYDNADHNTATIDGKNTFHCMGGIMCVTPSSSIELNTSIPRLKGALPEINNSNVSGFIPLSDFKSNKPFKLHNVTLRDWKASELVDFKIKIEPINLLYFFGKYSAPKNTANWHGFMNTYHSLNTDFSTTRVIPLQFIKAPPSDHRTILTALIDARKRANFNKQKHCFVTFDLPLFMKACEITLSIDPNNDPHNLRSVIVRLGGFHLLMSFNGSMNNIMAGSGLKEAFCTIYAELSAEKALSGHAFSRSVRGHLLVQAALASFIFEKVELSEDETSYLNNGLTTVGKENFHNYLANEKVTNVKEKFLNAIEKIEKNGPTSQLWVLYFKLVTLMQQFIDAERSGNFQLHLQTVISMIPIFFASGHHLYGKACLLYVEQMLNLKEKMDIIEYDKFCKQGFFTIRRSNRFWCGIWSDLCIEQVLMRAMKCCGGLTHGRGLTDTVIAKWILARAAVLEVGNAVELFCDVIFASSEQHIDNRASRINRDADDLSKIMEFFHTYEPFPETDKIIGIYSGIVGDLTSVNCHKTYEIGKRLMDETSNKKFTDVKFKKSSKIISLASANLLMKNLANEEVQISPLLIFQKLSLNIESQNDMKEYSSSYELSPIPLSLFDENGMRKTQKSAFYSNFTSINEIPTTNYTHVVDGGFLLHKVVWESNLKIGNIVSRYVSYVMRNYASNSFVIFDGYPENYITSTKSVERSRRHMKNIGREITFNNNTLITVNQKQFLSNERNKTKLIEFICTALKSVGFRTKIADEDADRLIVITAIENARLDFESTVIIVGEDTDLLVIITQLASDLNNIYFRKEGRGSDPHEYFGSDSFKYPDMKQIVMFLHAFSGCDTTSCFYKMGKNKLINCFSHEKLIELASIFYNSTPDVDVLVSNACEIIRGMYSNKAEKKLIEKSNSFSLNDLRYLHFSKAKLKTKFSLESLPPTEGAAKQHAFRVFYQIQLWLGTTNLQATDWGWQIRNEYLIPIGSTDLPIPQKLFDQITCSCSKKGCIDNSCTCRKNGLKCSNLCANCREDSCFNLDLNNLSVEVDEYDENGDIFDEENDNVNEYLEINYDVIDDCTPAKRRKVI